MKNLIEQIRLKLKETNEDFGTSYTLMMDFLEDGKWFVCGSDNHNDSPRGFYNNKSYSLEKVLENLNDMPKKLNAFVDIDYVSNGFGYEDAYVLFINNKPVTQLVGLEYEKLKAILR